jgi:Aspartyl protease
MWLISCCAFISFAATTFPTLHAAAHCPGKAASIPLRVVQSSLIVVPVQINHSGPYDFLVDTGAQISTVDHSLAVELHLKVEGVTGLGGVATYSRSDWATIELLQSGASSVTNSLAFIRDIPQLSGADSRIRGILGENFLAHFDLLIDNGHHVLCLDKTEALARAVKGEHVALAEPYGAENDLPFTRPIVVSARLSASHMAPVILRLDSGSNAPLLYAADPHIRKVSAGGVLPLKRIVDGVEQLFAVLPAQNVWVGAQSIRQISFVIPMNSIGIGPSPREDGLLPTFAFQRVFISYAGRYTVLESW